jgi:two-component system sensor histidine kinase UhpB
MLASQVTLCYHESQMNEVLRPFHRLQDRIFRLPIFNRVLIGNSIIIIVGAIGGTLITRHLTVAGNFNLIILFSLLGIFFTLLVNYGIIRSSLRPLRELSQAVDHVKNGQTSLPETLARQPDPDIHRLVTAMNSMLERLDRRTNQWRALSERAINAQEEERRRIARGLHDDTAQTISTLIIYLERLEAAPPVDPLEYQHKLSEIRRMATSMLEDLRKNIWDLRPTILDDLGLVPAIRWFAQSDLEKTGVNLQFNFQSENLRLSPPLETMLFRVSQEAVNNILHHANARTVRICLWHDQSKIWFEIEDDGQGFDVERTSGEAVAKKKLGLLGIQERVSLVGGEVKISSSPGQGTRLVAWVPLLKGNSFGLAHTETLKDQDTDKQA